MAVNWKKLAKRIPASVQVKKSLVYDIVWCDSFPRDFTQMGETNHDKKQIIIRNNMSPKLTVITYIHELHHAFSDNHLTTSLTESQILEAERYFYFILKPGNVFKE